VLEGDKDREPTIGQFPRQAQARRAQRRNIDRDLAPHRVAEQFEVAELEDLSRVVQAVASHDLAHDLDGLPQALQGPLVGDAVPPLDHPRPAGAQPQREAPARHLID
jgi:hypothetical protein